jgi:predicted membrane channel-forming protein YqfA (hemolysin III family)
MRAILNYDVTLYLKKCLSRMLGVTLGVLPLFFLNKLFATGSLRFILTLTVSEVWLIITVYLIGMERDERTSIRKYLRSAYFSAKTRLGVARQQS